MNNAVFLKTSIAIALSASLIAGCSKKASQTAATPDPASIKKALLEKKYADGPFGLKLGMPYDDAEWFGFISSIGVESK